MASDRLSQAGWAFQKCLKLCEAPGRPLKTAGFLACSLTRPADLDYLGRQALLMIEGRVILRFGGGIANTPDQAREGRETQQSLCAV